MSILEQQAEDRMSNEEILHLFSTISEKDQLRIIAMAKQLLAERNAKP